jgi:hypothetical protein
MKTTRRGSLKAGKMLPAIVAYLGFGGVGAGF